MSLDKVKAMRNAERFLAQGKLRAAISEYKRVVDFDKSDFNTLNMLGDLYVKASEQDEAVNCFTQVAEHYVKQGFAQKAIAIYNKISRLKPDLIEVSAKLAQLYQSKGSYAEAKTHYTVLADQYTKTGKKAEALGVWKQIASLDPYNTDIFLKIADACWQDQQKEEAANAYIEAGTRLNKKSQFESALTAFSRALEIRPDDLPALRGYASSQINLGYPEEAAKTLESSYARQPNSREIINLLADCYIEAGNLTEAEKHVIKLLEQEPNNYTKLLELFQAYLRVKEVTAAARILTMASEHMLVGGKALELELHINELLALDPEHLDGIRLLVRFHSWQRDESGIKTSFERLAEAAKQNNAVEDEIQALSQLVMIVPQNIYFAQRLQELKLSHGNSFGQFENNHSDVPTFESFQVLTDEENHLPVVEAELENYNAVETEHFENVEEPNEQIADSFETPQIGDTAQLVNNQYRELSLFERHGFQTEIEGIQFYVEQGFWDLASKTLEDVEIRFGNQPEIEGLRDLIGDKIKPIENPETIETVNNSEDSNQSEIEISETDFEKDFDLPENEPESVQEITEIVEESEEITTIENEFVSEEEKITEEAENIGFGEIQEDSAPITQNVEVEKEDSDDFDEPASFQTTKLDPTFVERVSSQNLAESFVQETTQQFNQPTNPLEELKSELNSSENIQPQPVVNEPIDDGFETSYQTGIVYREMGLIEDSIREFQDAIKRVSPHDGTRRYFLCCNMLGVCFMEKQMPTIAIMWFKKGLESSNLNEFELNGMKYELANAYDTAGEKQKARELFEEIYAIDVSFRDVGKRLMDLVSA